MKKTLIAIALAAMIAPAWGAEVVSSNIVGYNKVTLGHELTMTGTHFREVGSATTDCTLSQITLEGATGLNEDWDLGAALLMWNGTSYVGGQYYWVGPAVQDALPYKWVDDQYESADDLVIPAGTAFWIQDKALDNGTPATLTISGEVVSQTTPAPAEIKTELTMIANPYPQEVKLKDLVVTGKLTGLNEDWDLGAGLLMWNGTSYVGGQYYWVGDDVQDALPYKWVTDQYESADDVPVPVGAAFWIQDIATDGSATISFPKP